MCQSNFLQQESSVVAQGTANKQKYEQTSNQIANHNMCARTSVNQHLLCACCSSISCKRAATQSASINTYCVRAATQSPVCVLQLNQLQKFAPEAGQRWGAREWDRRCTHGNHLVLDGRWRLWHSRRWQRDRCGWQCQSRSCAHL